MTRRLCSAIGLWCVMVTGLHAQTQPEVQKATAQSSAVSADVAEKTRAVQEAIVIPKPQESQEAKEPKEPKEAQEMDAVPAALAQQRQGLRAQREAILTTYAQQQVACWQKFAVNACLSEARRTRRQALEPIRQQELVLNAQERAWRTAEREERLQGKQPAPKDKP